MSAKSPQQYRPSRRSWIKLWVSEWLDGTVRWQLNSQQRAIWADLLALAGYSRFPGIVTPGRDGKEFCAYPVAHLANIFGCSQETVRETLQLLEQQGRIAYKEGVVYILNWEKYQSEYQQKRQRRRYTEPTRADGDYVPRKSPKCPPKTPPEEVEVKRDGDKDIEGDPPRRREEIAAAVTAAFATMNCEPYGSVKFKIIWADEWVTPGEHTFADAMERTIQRCQQLKISVPGRFFAHKREIEKVEAEKNYKKQAL